MIGQQMMAVLVAFLLIASTSCFIILAPYFSALPVNKKNLVTRWRAIKPNISRYILNYLEMWAMTSISRYILNYLEMPVKKNNLMTSYLGQVRMPFSFLKIMR